MNMISRLLIVVFSFSLTHFGMAQPLKRVLVVSVTKGFRHDVIPTVDAMVADLAERSGKFEVDYVRTDEDMAEKMSPRSLVDYQAVVFNNTTGDLPLPNREAFLAWIKEGNGFVGLHSATDTFHGYPPFIDMIGAEFRTHHAQTEVEVLNMDPKHPANRPFGPTFRVFDEIYLVKNFDRHAVHGLLTLDQHPNDDYPGDFPIAWCKDYGHGRVFYTSLGHRHDVVQRADYQEHVLGGLLWVLGEEEGDAVPQTTKAILGPIEVAEGFRPLFNGLDLSGWKLRHPDGSQSWSAQNGMLVNHVPEDGHGTDLVTEEKFQDFTVRYEYMIPPGANSGFYLRGRYELQILDDYASGKATKSGNGSFYNYAAPAKFASRKPGDWQEAEITLRGNRVRVILNGVMVHDGLELRQATGGELDRDYGTPGPIFLQGDHGNIAFRNLRIKELN